MTSSSKIFFIVLLFVAVQFSFAKTPLMKNSKQQWEMIFEDDFNGNSLDWNIWSSDDSKYLKNETYRGKEGVEVRDGELLLWVKKASINNSKWIAASIFMNQVLENNSYVECRFKSTQCSGVNNAFWLANRSSQSTPFSNRYEIDVVEARLDVNEKLGAGHVAWHDWKTYYYTFDAKGNKMDIAQGEHVMHTFEEYHTWGLWYGENDFVIYLDGQPVWNGKTHKTYKDQWWTGVGKSKIWNPMEEKRTYGRFGQDDWSYMGGYNGDKLNVMLSTLPWGEDFTPLTDEADRKYMAVDYVRIYKLKGHQNTQAVEKVEKIGKSILLQQDYILSVDTNLYFSVVAEKMSNQPLEINFVDNSGLKAFSVGIDASNNLSAAINDKISSTKTAYPALERKKKALVAGGKYLLTGRITAHKNKSRFDRDALSFSVFDLAGFPVQQEPYFYPNIDATGNTSLTNGWDINVKNFSDAVFKTVQLKGGWKLSDFRIGYNFRSILPEQWQGATAKIEGCEFVKSKTECSFIVELTGNKPFSITYTVKGEVKELKNIQENRITLSIVPKENTVVKLLEVKDAEGKSGAVFGEAFAIVMNVKQNFIVPSFDTFTTIGKDVDCSEYQFFEMKGDPRYEREMYLSFDLRNITPTDKALFFIYQNENQKQMPLELDVFAVEVPYLAKPLTTQNKPGDSECVLLGKMKVPAVAGQYVGYNLGSIVAEYLAKGKQTLHLKVKFAKGDESNMALFYQGHGKVSEKGPKIIFM